MKRTTTVCDLCGRAKGDDEHTARVHFSGVDVCHTCQHEKRAGELLDVLEKAAKPEREGRPSWWTFQQQAGERWSR